MLSGICAPNAAITKADLNIAAEAGLQCVKLLRIPGCNHSVKDFLKYNARDTGTIDRACRLPDSRRPDGTYYSEQEYASLCASIIHELFYQAGVTEYQLDNEPNWTWCAEAYGPWEYQWFIHGVMMLLRAATPAGIRIFSPPLSFSPGLWTARSSINLVNPGPWTLDQWRHVYIASKLYDIFDLVSCNVYFNSYHQLTDPSYGLSYLTIFNEAGGKHIVVTEWASSAHRVMDPEEPNKRAYTDHEVEVMRLGAYPKWVTRAQESGIVERTYLFGSPGATQDWQGFTIDDSIAYAMHV